MPEILWFHDPEDIHHPMRPVVLWAPRFSNCLIWVRHMRRQFGGYSMERRAALCWRWHKNGKDHRAFFPHAMWSPDGVTCFEYTTSKPAWVIWWKLPFFILYPGFVQEVTRAWL